MRSAKKKLVERKLQKDKSEAIAPVERITTQGRFELGGN
jgi:hypothetical protein